MAIGISRKVPIKLSPVRAATNVAYADQFKGNTFACKCHHLTFFSLFSVCLKGSLTQRCKSAFLIFSK